MVRVTEKMASLELIAAPAIEKRILVVRGRQVMLDEDLADLYGVETKRLVEQVKRNVERFPRRPRRTWTGSPRPSGRRSE